MYTINAIAGLVDSINCPDPTKSGIINVTEVCSNCKYSYSTRRVRKSVATVQCLFDEEGDIYEEV